MRPFEKLTKSDKDTIDSVIRCYVPGGNKHADVEYLMRFWDTQKTKLFDIFGEQLVLCKDITFKKSSQELEEELDTGLYQNDSLRGFINAFRNIWRNFPDDEDGIRWKLEKLINPFCLAKNEYRGDTFFLPTPHDKPIKVQHGCKASKIIGKIAEAYCIDGFEEFRLVHSQCLNQKALSGKLCLSIHPLDYMTASMNGYGWTSCMNWDDGEYCRGTVEMMNSPYVVCAYLEGEDYWEVTPTHPCANKKWREFFIVSPDTICGIKGYPYWNRDIEKVAVEWLRELVEANGSYGHFTQKVAEFHPNSDTWESVEGLGKTKYKFRFETCTMYNDFYSDHYGVFNTDMGDQREVFLNYSGCEECMICGREDRGFSNEGCLACEDCDDSLFCYNCGCRVDHFDAYEVDGEYFCECCYDDLYSCTKCGEIHTGQCIHEVCVSDGKFLIPSICMPLCDSCFEELKADSTVKLIEYYSEHGWHEFNNYIDIKDIPDYMFDRDGRWANAKDLREDGFVSHRTKINMKKALRNSDKYKQKFHGDPHGIWS